MFLVLMFITKIWTNRFFYGENPFSLRIKFVAGNSILATILLESSKLSE